MLILLVGFAFVALGIEAARLMARVERWRTTLVDDTRPLDLLPVQDRRSPAQPSEPTLRGSRSSRRAVFFDL